MFLESMPLSSELEALCQRLEMGRPELSAAALMRQQLVKLTTYGIGSAVPTPLFVARRRVTSFRRRSSRFALSLSGIDKAHDVSK
jgi:hypothetical protein